MEFYILVPLTTVARCSDLCRMSSFSVVCIITLQDAKCLDFTGFANSFKTALFIGIHWVELNTIESVKTELVYNTIFLWYAENNFFFDMLMNVPAKMESCLRQNTFLILIDSVFTVICFVKLVRTELVYNSIQS